MTRDEQISEKAKYYADCVNKKYHIPESIQRLIKSAYVVGAKFADKHPNTNEHPNNVWHDITEEPEEESFLVLYSDDGFRVRSWPNISHSWASFVDYYYVLKWTYLSDPK